MLAKAIKKPAMTDLFSKMCLFYIHHLVSIGTTQHYILVILRHCLTGLFKKKLFFSNLVHRDVEYLARVQPLISKIVHVDLNQRTTKMLIDESKMTVDSFSSFLN